MRNQINTLIFRISIVISGIIVLLSYSHFGEDSSADLIHQAQMDRSALANQLSKKYQASVIRNKLNQKKLIDTIMANNGAVVADSVIKDFYQKGKEVFVLLEIKVSSQNIYAKLKCSGKIIDEYFELKSNKVLAVFKSEKLLFTQPFYESERWHDDPLILSGENEIFISGKCMELIECPSYLVNS